MLGTRDSETFSTKAESIAWAGRPNGKHSCAAVTPPASSRVIVAGKTCLQEFERYRDDVSVHKKGARWETIRLSAIANHIVADKKLATTWSQRFPQTSWGNGAICA